MKENFKKSKEITHHGRVYYNSVEDLKNQSTPKAPSIRAAEQLEELRLANKPNENVREIKLPDTKVGQQFVIRAREFWLERVPGVDPTMKMFPLELRKRIRDGKQPLFLAINLEGRANDFRPNAIIFAYAEPLGLMLCKVAGVDLVTDKEKEGKEKRRQWLFAGLIGIGLFGYVEYHRRTRDDEGGEEGHQKLTT